MQQCVPNRIDGVVPVAHRPCAIAEGRLHHRGLLLTGSWRSARGAGPRDVVLARRVLDRLLQPAALVEGVDLHLGDSRLAERAAAATGFVLVLPPVGNLSNPFYAVHPRRNDRFVGARAPLRALFPEVDFAPFAFTGHALGTLAATCPERFSQVRQGLNLCWQRRMTALLTRLPADGVLLSVPQPPFLALPALDLGGRAVIGVDPDDRVPGARALASALFTRRRETRNGPPWGEPFR